MDNFLIARGRSRQGPPLAATTTLPKLGEQREGARLLVKRSNGLINKG